MSEGKNYKKWVTLVVLFVGSAVIFQLPYLRETFYVPFTAALGLTNEQFGMLTSVYATVSIFSYFFGGWLADRVSVRKLFTFSFLSTGLVGIWFSTFPSYNTLLVIFGIMGVTTVLTYWPAFIKAIRNLGTSEEQGRMYGIAEGGRGVTSAVVVLLLQQLFFIIVQDNVTADSSAEVLALSVVGLGWVLRIFSLLYIIIGIITFVLVADDEKPEKKAEPLYKEIGKVILMPRVWFICLIIFTAYSIYALMAMFPKYMVDQYGMSTQLSMNMGAYRYIMQLFGGIAGGFLADKIGSRIKVITGGFFLLTASLIAFYFLPQTPALLAYCIANFVILGVVVYSIRGLYFSIIDEAGIEKSSTGATSGFASCVGYIPDVFLSAMVGSWIDSGVEGYGKMFLYAIATCIAGIVVCFFFIRTVKKVGGPASAKIDN